MAAPIIRYKVGDIVTLDGFQFGRVKVSEIRRAREIAIGDCLLPLSVVEGWPEEARACGHAVRSIQLLCRTGEQGIDQIVVRLIGAESPAAIEQWIRGAMMEIPQLRDTASHSNGVIRQGTRRRRAGGGGATEAANEECHCGQMSHGPNVSHWILPLPSITKGELYTKLAPCASLHFLGTDRAPAYIRPSF
jgi:hypothetical protein